MTSDPAISPEAQGSCQAWQGTGIFRLSGVLAWAWERVPGSLGFSRGCKEVRQGLELALVLEELHFVFSKVSFPAVWVFLVCSVRDLCACATDSRATTMPSTSSNPAQRANTPHRWHAASAQRQAATTRDQMDMRFHVSRQCVHKSLVPSAVKINVHEE